MKLLHLFIPAVSILAFYSIILSIRNNNNNNNENSNDNNNNILTAQQLYNNHHNNNYYYHKTNNKYNKNTNEQQQQIVIFSNQSNNSLSNKNQYNDSNNSSQNNIIIHNIHGIENVEDGVGKSFWEQTICLYFNQNIQSFTTKLYLLENQPFTYINISFSCLHIYQDGKLGTGNLLMSFYSLRLAAKQIGNIDLSITCTDAIQEQNHLILPWVMGQFTKTIWKNNIPPRRRKHPSIIGSCRYQYWVYMLPDMIYELRRMAIAMVGIPYIGHPSEQWANQYLWSNSSNNDKAIRYTNSVDTNINQQHQQLSSTIIMQIPTPPKHSTPIYPNVELDDVIIHFRCGDVMDSNRGDFGFIQFQSIAKYIPYNVKSIGILTQPFHTSNNSSSTSSANAIQQRKLDENANTHNKCQRVVYALHDYLRNLFPVSNNTFTNVKISIRNDSKETITLTLSRMIMANISIIGVSTFGVIGGLTTFGSSYIQNIAFNKMLLKQLVKDTSSNKIQKNTNLHLIHEPFLPANTTTKMWKMDDGETVLKWLTT